MIRSVGLRTGEASSAGVTVDSDGWIRLALSGRRGGERDAITLFSFDARALGERLISESVIAGMARREGEAS